MTQAAATRLRSSASTVSVGASVSVEALLPPGPCLEQRRAAVVSCVNIGNAIGSVLQDGVQVT